MTSSTKNNLSPKQERFVSEYIYDLNAKQAAIRSGYSEKTAEKIGWQQLENPRVRAAIEEKKKRLAIKVDVSTEWVIQELKKLYQETYDLKEFQYSFKALELIGKHTGAYIEKLQLTGKDGGPIQNEVDIKAKISLEEINNRISGLLG